MSNPFEVLELLAYQPTGNVAGTLNAAGSTNTPINEGVWAIWADKAYYLQVADATGTTIGANPTCWPAYHVNYYAVQPGSTKYVGIKRFANDGNFFVSKITIGAV